MCGDTSSLRDSLCGLGLFGGRFFDLAVEPGEKFAMRLRVVKFAEVFEFGIRSVAVPELSVDRKSVVSGKSVSVRVDLGGRRNIKKKKKTYYCITCILPK